MATDATGAPTSLGIPTYNINVDAPSGNGFNAAMAEINTLISARAPLASPALTGTPTAPTPVSTDNTTKIATTAFVKAQGYLTSAVSSFNSRTGAVLPASGDYTAAQVTNAADLSDASQQTFAGSVGAGAGVNGGTGSPAGALLNSAGVFQVSRTGATGTAAFTITQPGADTQFRFIIDVNGRLQWGPGGGTATDTFLSRTSAGVVNLNADPPTNDNSHNVATTAFVKAQPYADKSSASVQVFSGGVQSASASGGFGYATGAGGTGSQTQALAPSTGVTINRPAGSITVTSVSLAPGASFNIKLNNSTVGPSDVLVVASEGVTAGTVLLTTGITSTGTVFITVYNISGGTITNNIVINFALVQSVTS